VGRATRPAPTRKKVVMTTHGSRGRGPSEYLACEFCGTAIHRRMMTQHLKYACTEQPSSQEQAEAPPGSIVGFGTDARKKRWTWGDLESYYPKEGWINANPTSNPVGGITWNGLHVELVTDRRNPGCFLVKGQNRWEYSRRIPPPFWDAYQQHLDSMAPNESVMRGMLGEDVPMAVGGLEPERAWDTETGATYDITYNAEGRVVLR